MRALFAIIRNDFIICMHFRFDPIYAHGFSGIGFEPGVRRILRLGMCRSAV